MDETEDSIMFIHSTDPLENLTYLTGKCLICNTEHRGTFMAEMDSGAALCRCGNTVIVNNRTRWH